MRRAGQGRGEGLRLLGLVDVGVFWVVEGRDGGAEPRPQRRRLRGMVRVVRR